MIKTIKSIAFVLTAMLSPLTSLATPIDYNFSTDVASGGTYNGFPPATFSGLSVSGSFSYNPDAALTSIGPLGHIYAPAFTQLSGTVGGDSFSTPYGAAIVGNNRPDHLILFAGGHPSLPLAGFNAAPDYSLWRMRFIWAVGILNTPDFLSDESLLSELPRFSGRLALDFQNSQQIGTNQFSSVFFENLTASAVPEPATLSLLGLGLVGIAVARKKKQTA